MHSTAEQVCIHCILEEKAQLQSSAELSTSTAAELLYLLCFTSKASYLLFLERLSQAKYGRSLSGSTFDVPNLERELMFGPKPRVGPHVWSKTFNGSAGLKQNLERELWFGAKPQAGAPIGSETSRWTFTFQLFKSNC